MAPPLDDAPVASWVQVREPVVPKAVRGRIRTAKWAVMAVLMAIYYGAPWLRWDRGPYAPDQAILIDLPGSKAYFFLFEIWPQEIYVLTGVLIMMAVGLFLITALLGRAWCGWACPQTVWTDLYMLVERLIEGDRTQRLRLARTPWGPRKLALRLATHSAWIAIAALTGGAWVLYFADAPTVVREVVTLEASSGVWATIGLLTGSTYLLAGWARENVCTFMCPYARFQGAMMDRDSLVVSYRPQRGEPRGKHRSGESWDGRGHCVDCRQCVEVCPTGVDIRDGLQFGCISCGLCIDACHGIMKRLGLPTDLIGYDTERNLAAPAGTPPRWRLLRPRTVIYAVMYAAIGLGVLAVMLTRSTLEMSALPDRNPLFVRLSDAAIRNTLTLKILNKSNLPRQVTIVLVGLPEAQLSMLGRDDTTVALKPDAVATVRAFVTLPGAAWHGAAGYRIEALDLAAGTRAQSQLEFAGPAR
ncbi:MAG: cytochrome c oxidase accessory protein CcoG [Proteobacteria bacterium]|nr:cytochrome c oxidase accessory protein CcoG [Pseudomonadota bacterium]